MTEDPLSRPPTDEDFIQNTWLIDSSTHNMLSLCDPFRIVILGYTYFPVCRYAPCPAMIYHPSQSSLSELRPDRRDKDNYVFLTQDGSQIIAGRGACDTPD